MAREGTVAVEERGEFYSLPLPAFPPLPPPPLSPTTSIFPRRKDKTKNKAGRKGGEKKKKKKKKRGISEKGRKCCLLNPGKMKRRGTQGGRKGPWHEKKFPAKVPRFRKFWSGKARFFVLN